MNIAILIPSLKTGGAEKAASLLGNYFCEKGHNVFYFLMAESGRKFFHTKGDIVYTHIPYPYSLSDTKDEIRELFFAAGRLKKIKRTYNIDISVSFMEAYNVLNVCSKRKEERIYVSVRTVLSERSEFKGVIYNRYLIRRLYNKADGVISVSDGVKMDLVNNYGIKTRRITTIPNISVSDSYDLTERGRTKDILFIGRLDPVKQVDVIIRAFSYVYDKDENAKLVIVGDGKQKNELVNLAKRLEIDDRINFLGMRKNITEYLQSCACFVMASRVEGFPNAMMEAMALGAPVISTDSPGGCGEILGRKGNVKGIQYCDYGILVPYILGRKREGDYIEKNEVLLGKAMYRLISDRILQDRYAEMSKLRSRDYSPDRIFPLWDIMLGL